MTPEERVGMLDEIPEWGRSLFEKCANFRNTFCAEIADLRFPIIYQVERPLCRKADIRNLG
jgi:hypothetical protein